MFLYELPKEADIVIIGAGVVGLSLARELSKYDVNVVVIEKESDVGLGLTSKNMGVVHPFIPQTKTRKFELCIKGNKLFDELSRELSFPFKRVGLYIVALNLVESLFLRFIKLWLKIRKINFMKVGKRELKDLIPNINENARYALYVPTAGVTDPIEFSIALAENASKNGVKIVLECNVSKIVREDDSIKIITDKGVITSKFVINAGGLDSREIMKIAGEKPYEINPGLGVMIIFEPKGETYYHNLVAEVPLRVDQRTKGGAAGVTVYEKLIWGPNFRDVDNLVDEKIAFDDIEFIMNKFSRLFPKVSLDDVIYFYAGIRPASREGDFIIEMNEKTGFINIAGIQSPGLTAAPAIAKEVVELLSNKGFMLKEKKSFDPYRKPIPRVRDMSINDLEKEIEENKTYGTILCSEIPISEGEVIEAIRRGARTVKAVFNRLGLGWHPIIQCECAVKVAEVLSKELGVELKDVTFEGKGTELGRDVL